MSDNGTSRRSSQSMEKLSSETPYGDSFKQIGDILKRLYQNPWIPKLNNEGKPYKPNKKQMQALLMQDVDDLFFGGAVGGGKSEFFLQDASLYLDVPGYAALILRKKRRDLKAKGGLIPRSKQWWMAHPGNKYGRAKFDGHDFIWEFPTRDPSRPSSVSFGYLDHEDDENNYGSTEYQRVYADESGQIRPYQLEFLFSRMRGTRDITDVVPTGMRSASNPGLPYHAYIKSKYVDDVTRSLDSAFIPSTLDDNIENVDIDKYNKSLEHLDPVRYQQLRHGDWEVQSEGQMFDRTWYDERLLDHLPELLKGQRYVATRYWDMAATKDRKGKNPAWTAGCLMAKMINSRADAGERENGLAYIMDMVRSRQDPQGVEKLLKTTAAADAALEVLDRVDIHIEQEGGGQAKILLDYYQRQVLGAYSVTADKVTKSKEDRAVPLSTKSRQGHIWIVKGPWMNDFFNELEAFPNGKIKDQVDCTSGALNKLYPPSKGQRSTKYQGRSGSRKTRRRGPRPPGKV